MNQSVLHIYLAERIANQVILAKLNEIEPFHLCFWRSEIEVHNVQHTFMNHPVFHRFTGRQVHQGVTPAELLKITKPIIEFLQGNLKWQKQFRH